MALAAALAISGSIGDRTSSEPTGGAAVSSSCPSEANRLAASATAAATSGSITSPSWVVLSQAMRRGATARGSRHVRHDRAEGLRGKAGAA